MAPPKTRQKQSQKCEIENQRLRMKSKDPKEKEKARLRSAEARRRKKIEIQLLKDEIIYWKENAQKWKNEAQKLKEQFRQVEEDCHFKDEFNQTHHQSEVESEVEPSETEEIEPPNTPNLSAIIEPYLLSTTHLKQMTRMSKEAFDALVTEITPAFEKTTWRGTYRMKKKKAKVEFPIAVGIFLTLFWMAHYPTLALMGSLFNLHTFTLSRILKRTTFAMATALAQEIKWPSDEELTAQTYSFLQNDGFYDAVCVVDGTEIKIS